MSDVTVNVNVAGDTAGGRASSKVLREELDDLIAIMGHDIKAFPKKGVDGFLSHFIITLEMPKETGGDIFTLNMPSAMQTVSRSEPFIYRGISANHKAELSLPKGSNLPSGITEQDFLNKPTEFFEEGVETVWMQILNLDARMEDTPIGPIRIILGETVKREYPDLFHPSLGVAQSLSKKNGGFPARLFFNPYAIIETKLGAMRAIHGNLSYGRTIAFPPIGTPISINECIPLEPVQDIMKMGALRAVDTRIKPIARILALSHPIDTMMQIPGEDAHQIIENIIDKNKAKKNKKE